MRQTELKKSKRTSPRKTVSRPNDNLARESRTVCVWSHLDDIHKRLHQEFQERTLDRNNEASFSIELRLAAEIWQPLTAYAMAAKASLDETVRELVEEAIRRRGEDRRAAKDAEMPAGARKLVWTTLDLSPPTWAWLEQEAAKHNEDVGKTVERLLIEHGPELVKRLEQECAA